MICPKCKAKIGILRELYHCEVGLVAGIICYMCGFWLQESQPPQRDSE